MPNHPTGRALELLSLLQTHRWWRGSDLAARLAVTERTLRRDVDRLRALGYPVDATAGPHGGYRLATGAHLPPLLLDDEEAVAVAVGLRYTAGGAIGGVEETSLRALTKIEGLLPAHLRRRVSAVHTHLSVMPLENDGVVDGALLGLVAAACRDTEALRFTYRRHDATESARHVEPAQLVTAGRRWYLIAWDRDRDDWRTFRVDRLSDVRPTGRRFAARDVPGDDAVTHLAESLAAMPRPHVARVEVQAPVGELEGSFPWVEHTVVESHDANCTLELRAEDRGRLMMTIARLALLATVTVLEPDDVADDARQLASRLVGGS